MWHSLANRHRHINCVTHYSNQFLRSRGWFDQACSRHISLCEKWTRPHEDRRILDGTTCWSIIRLKVRTVFVLFSWKRIIVVQASFLTRSWCISKNVLKHQRTKPYYRMLGIHSSKNVRSIWLCCRWFGSCLQRFMDRRIFDLVDCHVSLII